MRRKNQKLLAFFLAIPLILGLIVGFLSRPTASYEALVKPFFRHLVLFSQLFGQFFIF